MRALTAMPSEEARRLSGVLFDLDDTFLDGTRLRSAALAALEALALAGLRLVAVTGRPSGWGAAISRQWPVDGVVTENGAVADYMEGGRCRRRLLGQAADPEANRQRLLRIVQETRGAFPELVPTDDVAGRVSDYTFDVGEHERVAPDIVARAMSFAEARGARTSCSSVHLHLTLDAHDKASGVVAFLTKRFGLDPTLCRSRFAFIGDSGNDAACFAAFGTTVGVANLRGRPTVVPRYRTMGARSAGFVEFSDRILALRG